MYTMRFFVEAGPPPTLDDIQRGVGDFDVRLRLTDDGALFRLDQRLAELAVYRAGTHDFGEEVAELVGAMEAAVAPSAARTALGTRLRNVTGLVEIEVDFQDRSVDATLDMLAPLWTCLETTWRGFSQADGEGYYEGDDLILATG